MVKAMQSATKQSVVGPVDIGSMSGKENILDEMANGTVI